MVHSSAAVRSPQAWRGVRLRRVRVAADPDGTARSVQLPMSWDDAAASALAALAPGVEPVSLAGAAQSWLDRLPAELAEPARALLLTRRAAPDRAIWQGGRDGYAINLAAFDEPGLGLDAAGLRSAAALAVAVLGQLDPGHKAVLRLTDLDGLLAAGGLDYASPAGRAAAVAVVAQIRDAAPGATLRGEAGLVDGLLGAEAGGIAPRFDWLDAHGRLSRGAMGFLAARGVSAKTALAATLRGRPALPLADAAAHTAMRTALADLLGMADVATPDRASARRDLPPRPGGYARRVSLGGHKLFVRTAEFADGSLAEVSIGLPKEAAPVRALADCLSHVVSLALQHGVPLGEIVDVFTGTKFGPAGTVDGDPQTTVASSPLDYLARSLAAAYLPGVALEPADPEPAAAPLLPLEMPPAGPRLRVVR